MIRRYGDLWATAVLAGASTAVFETDLESAPFRLIAGILLVLLLPGYALGRALFRRPSLGGPERVLISLALSAAVGILGTPLLNATSLALTRHTWPVLLCGVTFAGCLAAWVAGRDEPIRLRGLPLPRVRDVVLLGAAIAVASAAVALGRAPLDPPKGVTGYTQLWLAPHGKALQLGVQSEELDRTTYRLLVLADGRLVRRWRRIELGTGDRWVVALPRKIGRLALDAYLYKLDKPTSVYRRVHVHPGLTGTGP